MIIVWGSILIGKPFTEAYARQTTPQQYWHSPETSIRPTCASRPPG